MLAMTDHREKDIKFHADIAAAYDYLTVEPRELPIELLFKNIDRQIRPSHLMIDLGCGTGHMLCRHNDKFQKVIGVDHSREMLDQAEAKPDLKQEKISFILSDIDGFLDAYTGPQPDFVSIVGFLHHLEKHELTQILKKIHNFLVAGGQVLIAEPILCAKTPQLVTWINSKSILNKRLAKAMPPHTEDPDEEPLVEHDLIKSINEAGFQITSTNKAYDIIHLNYPPKFWEKIFFRLVSFLYNGKNGDVIAILAGK